MYHLRTRNDDLVISCQCRDSLAMEVQSLGPDEAPPVEDVDEAILQPAEEQRGIETEGGDRCSARKRVTERWHEPNGT